MNGETRKFKDLDELSSSAAQDIADLMNKVVQSKGVFHLALSGGNTPRTLYRLLGTIHGKSIPWSSVHIFFCDERFVPHQNPLSNFKMIKEVLIESIPADERNIHGIPTNHLNMKISARNYESELRRFLDDTKGSRSTSRDRLEGASLSASFDLAIMGVGKEGHTASLFPNSPALDEKEKWVLGVEVNAVPPQRITLTYPILNRSEIIYVLVSGSDKAELMSELSKGAADPHIYPAAGLNPQSGNIVWWVDSNALP